MLRKIIQSIKVSEYQGVKVKVKDYILCIFSELLLIFSFPNFYLGIFAWFGFVPFFFAIRGKPKAKVFLLSYFTGIIFWFGIIYWLVHVTLIGLILLVLYLALYFGIFGLIITTYNLQLTTYNCLFIPSIWVLLEYLRSHLFTGFPWALLGYSQYLNLPIIQIADITGAWGVSFLLMMGNVAIYSALSYKPSAISKKQKYLLPVLILIIALTYGYFKIYRLQLTTYNLKLKVSVIQGNIPQELKWDIDAREFIVDRYLTLSVQAVQDKPDLIIWPEAAFSDFLNPQITTDTNKDSELLLDFIRQTKIPLLLGAVINEDAQYFNSAILIPKDGNLLQRYDKIHLVPFGEFIPFKKAPAAKDSRV